MSIWIEDSPRNLAGWIIESVSSGSASGAVITPWATPFQQHAGAGRKPSAANRIAELQAGGVNVMFDPMTHVLQMSGVGDLRFYDEYDLWAGARGDLSDQALIEGHVDKVFGIQDSLNVSHCAPTVLLHSGLEMFSVVALDVARSDSPRSTRGADNCGYATLLGQWGGTGRTYRRPRFLGPVSMGVNGCQNRD